MNSSLRFSRYLALVLPILGLSTSLAIGCGVSTSEDVGRHQSSIEHGYDGYGYDGYDGYGYDGYGYDGYGYDGYGYDAP